MQIQLKKEIFDQLEFEYDFTSLGGEPLGQEHFRNVFKITSGNNSYVLRIFPPERGTEQLKKDVEVLKYLEDRDFPAPRLIKTKKNEYSTWIENSPAIVISYIDGNHPNNNSETMRKMGQLAAKLHLQDSDESYPYHASWGVKEELAVIKENMLKKSIQELPDPENIVAQVHKALEELPSLKDLPQTIIHTDIHAKNIIERPNGDFVLIDWDDAGRGTAILDIAYILAQVCIRFSNKETFEPVWEAEWAKSLLAGYQSIRKLTELEKQYLLDAMKFSSLAYVIHYWVPKIDIQTWNRYLFMQQNERDLLKSIRG